MHTHTHTHRYTHTHIYVYIYVYDTWVFKPNEFSVLKID